jgi:hypothetical protein
MTSLEGFYNPNAEAATDFAPLPAGEYVAEISAASIEPISNTRNLGHCLKITWKVNEGEFTNRLVFQRLNLRPSGEMNNSAKVEAIAETQFAAIRQAIGLGGVVVKDVAEILFKQAIIRLSVKIDPNGQYSPQNEVKGYKPYAMALGAPMPQASPPAAASAPAPRAAPPAGKAPLAWQR